jgi:short-subunit dehydrogenase
MSRQNILITGASSGLGEGMARLFAAQGRDLALTARRVDRLEALPAELTTQHPGIRVAVQELDVNDHNAVFRVFGACRDEPGGLDRVIVNAGLGKGARVGDACHLVVSSVSAFRGMPGSMTTYAATKAGIATLAEGIRSDCLHKPIAVTAVFPGYIRSEMNERVEQAQRLMIDTDTGCRALVAAIEKEPAEAEVPAWPWKPIGYALRHLPLQVVRRMV